MTSAHFSSGSTHLLYKVTGFIFQEINWIISINPKHGKSTVQSLQLRSIDEVIAGTYLSAVPLPGQSHVPHSPCYFLVSSEPTSPLVSLFTHMYVYYWKPIKYVQDF